MRPATAWSRWTRCAAMSSAKCDSGFARIAIRRSVPRSRSVWKATPMTCRWQSARGRSSTMRRRDAQRIRRDLFFCRAGDAGHRDFIRAGLEEAARHEQRERRVVARLERFTLPRGLARLGIDELESILLILALSDQRDDEKDGLALRGERRRVVRLSSLPIGEEHLLLRHDARLGDSEIGLPK